MNYFPNTPARVIFITMLVTSIGITIANAQGPWNRKADFGGTGRRGAVGFSIGNKGYIGTGDDRARKRDFWEYDPGTNSWTQKADFGGLARAYAVGFAIGLKGYIGTGLSVDGKNLGDFWEYDPATNSWTRKADFGGAPRWYGVGFSVGEKGYIGLGLGPTKDFWEYNPQTNTWTRKADYPGSASYASTGISIGNKGYVGTGEVWAPLGWDTRDFWEFDPATNSWNQKADFGGLPRSSAVGFSIANKGYIGTGSNMNDFWRYDPATNSWALLIDSPGERANAVAFSYGLKGYLGTGLSWTTSGYAYRTDFWEYDPSFVSSVQLASPPDLSSIEVDSTDRKIVLLWYPSHPAPIDYDLVISSDSAFTRMVFRDSTTAETNYLWTEPKNDSKYWWKVRPKTNAGWGSYSNSRSFSTIFGGSRRVDVMIVYTTSAESLANSMGGIDLVIAQGMIKGQQALYNSGLSTTINLVHTALVDYVENKDSSDALANITEDLRRLTNKNDGYLDYLHDWRITFGADEVVLLTTAAGVDGIAWLLTQQDGEPEFGFAVVGVRSVFEAYSLIHEIGHNWGCHHSREQGFAPAPPSGGLFKYSTAWFFTGVNGNGYSTVMAYPLNGHITVPLFSNPGILVEGAPTGSYDINNPYAPADNARTVREITSVIAGYSSRLASTSIADRDNLTNIPDRFILHQNYPNPFNPSTNIEYSLPKRTKVQIAVYDILGREAAIIENRTLAAGVHKLIWDGINSRGVPVSSGLYLLRLVATPTDHSQPFVATRKMLLLR